VSDSTRPFSKVTPIASQIIAPKNQRNSSKPTSHKKIEANRRNALHSTGPKTERGKLTVSRNAIKHGLLSRQAVITRGNGAEDPEEFAQLLAAFREDLQPVGINEELLVEKIATSYWRQARVLRCEVGETRKRLNNVVVPNAFLKSNEANRDIALLQMFEMGMLSERDTTDQKLSTRERFEATQKLQSDLRMHPLGIAYLRNILASVKAEIQEKRKLSEKLLDTLECTIGYCDNALMLACRLLTRSEEHDEKGGASGPSTAQNSVAQREFAIRLLDRQLEALDVFDEWAKENQLRELDAQLRSLALPDEAATDKVLRYETHLDRQLYRAMDQLERLQRRRKGENVPPPLNVNWGGRRVFAKQTQ